MKLRVCVAGATGWVGSALCEAIIDTDDLNLVGAVSRTKAGSRIEGTEVAMTSTVAESLAVPTDVLVDYTRADIVKSNVLAAIEKGVHVVVGSSGLTGEDFAEITSAAESNNIGVIAAGNYAITAVLLQRFACEAAKYLSHFEILDYGKSSKPDAPSGTAHELSFRLSEIKKPDNPIPINETLGEKEARGATLNGIQMHSVRLPGFISSVEALFGSEGERLSIRHDSTDSAEPYIQGTLLAIRKVSKVRGLVRGLDRIMDQ